MQEKEILGSNARGYAKKSLCSYLKEEQIYQFRKHQIETFKRRMTINLKYNAGVEFWKRGGVKYTYEVQNYAPYLEQKK
jgi:hypothetical protein